MGVVLDRALWRAIAVFRVPSLGYAVGLVAHNHGFYDRPIAAWAVLVAMAVWTVATTIWYGNARLDRGAYS